MAHVSNVERTKWEDWAVRTGRGIAMRYMSVSVLIDVMNETLNVEAPG